MPGSAQRYIGGAVGFAFAAVWATAGLGSALVCIVAAAIGYTAVRLAEGPAVERDLCGPGSGARAPESTQ